MKYVLYLLLLLASCKENKPGETVAASPITGKWQYERIELYEDATVQYTDSLVQQLDKMHQGLCFAFSAKNIFRVTQFKSSGVEEFVAEQPFELAADQKTLDLKNNGRPDDHFPIISLNDSVLKINAFKSKEGYLVFRKIKS